MSGAAGLKNGQSNRERNWWTSNVQSFHWSGKVWFQLRI